MSGGGRGAGEHETPYVPINKKTVSWIAETPNEGIYVFRVASVLDIAFEFHL